MCSLCHIRDVFRHCFLKSQCIYTRSFLFVTCLHLWLPLATSLWMHFFVMFSHLFIFVIHIITLLWFSLFRVSTCAMCFYAKCIFGIHVSFSSGSLYDHCTFDPSYVLMYASHWQCRHQTYSSVDDARNRFLRRNMNQTIRWPDELHVIVPSTRQTPTLDNWMWGLL